MKKPLTLTSVTDQMPETHHTTPFTQYIFFLALLLINLRLMTCQNFVADLFHDFVVVGHMITIHVLNTRLNDFQTFQTVCIFGHYMLYIFPVKICKKITKAKKA